MRLCCAAHALGLAEVEEGEEEEEEDHREGWEDSVEDRVRIRYNKMLN